VIAVQIPNSTRAQVGRPWMFAAPAGHAILAVGQSRSKRRVVVLAQQENELTVHVLSKRGGLANQVWRCTAVNYQLPQPTDGMALRPLGFFDQGCASSITAATSSSSTTAGSGSGTKRRAAHRGPPTMRSSTSAAASGSHS
jgi:hypothetical protein